jgi:hypothetical protein
MTSTPSEREAALRRALLSAAEQIEPAPGGLERIQGRLRRPRPALVAWAEAAWTALVMRAPDVTEAIRRRAADVLRLAWERFGPRPAPGGGPHRLSWVRPLAAMSVAVFVLGAGAYVALQSVSSPISTTGGVGPGTLVPGGGSRTVGGGPNGSGTTDGHGSQSPYSSASRSPRSSPSCTPSPSATPYNSGQASTGPPFQSTDPTTGSTSPSTTPPSTSTSPPVSPTPTPTVTTSPANGGSASTPDAGLTSENPASTGGNASTGTGSSDATLSAALSSAATGKSTPCQSAKPKASTATKQP